MTEENRSPSQNPPCSIPINEVPQFVTIGFDDNRDLGSIKWILDTLSKKGKSTNSALSTFDSEAISFSFYLIGEVINIASKEWRDIWIEVYKAGHEIGNHSYGHPNGYYIDWEKDFYLEKLTFSNWKEEISKCNEEIMKLNIPRSSICGFRAPFLEYTSSSLKAAKSIGLEYDCSIQEGYQDDQNGTNYYWPYTLNDRSPGNYVIANWVSNRKPINKCPGLWEMPVYALIAPPDEECEKYHLKPGFRARMAKLVSNFDANDGKISGFDYNLWYLFQMTAEEVFAVLKYTFDLRLQGNRCPFIFGAHSDYYDTDHPERRKVLVDFIDYALSKPEVRIVNTKKILEWCKNPTSFFR